MYLTQNSQPHSPVGSSVLAVLNRVAAAITGFFVALHKANERQRQYEVLSSLSDEALAARGLKRHELVRKVFADYLV